MKDQMSSLERQLQNWRSEAAMEEPFKGRDQEGFH